MQRLYVLFIYLRNCLSIDEVGQIITLAQRDTLGSQYRVSSNQMEEKVGLAVHENSLLDSNLKCSSSRHTIVLVNKVTDW